MSDKIMRDTIAALYGDRYGIDGRGWHAAPKDVAVNLGRLGSAANSRRDLRRRCLAIAWKSYCLDEVVDHDGSCAIEIAAELVKSARGSPYGAEAYVFALEFVQARSPALDPDELDSAAIRCLAFFDGENDAEAGNGVDHTHGPSQ